MAKKIILLILALTLATVFAGCSKSTKPKNGTYKSDDGLLSQTWTFSGDNKVALSVAGGLVSTDGTYSISGDTLTITASLLGTTSTSSYMITEITSKSFFIDGSKFVKQ